MLLPCIQQVRRTRAFHKPPGLPLNGISDNDSNKYPQQERLNMSYATTQPADDHITRQHAALRASDAAQDVTADPSSGRLDVVGGRQLLGDSRLWSRANTAVRASTLQSMQQTHRNRAVQRTLAVQRQSLNPAEFQDPEVRAKIEAMNDPTGYGKPACDADPFGYGGPCDPPKLPQELEKDFKLYRDWANMPDPDFGY